MKRYLLLVACVVMMIPFSGCKKKQSFDPTTKSQDEFIGTWRGTISTFKNNRLMKESSEVVIYRVSEEYLSGIIFMNSTLVFSEFQFLNGTLYFRVPCNDPSNPNCQTWNLGGYAVFSETGKIDFRISGNECGPFGSEFVDWNGMLAQIQVDPDSIMYYNFAKAGNSWDYKITLKNGDTCQVQKQINESPSDYFFQGVSTQNCGWSGTNMSLKWSVAPSNFTIGNDSTLCQNSFTFPINAKQGVVYTYIIHNDTTTITMVDSNLVVTTPAGNFNCARFRYTEPVMAGAIKITKTAWLWLNNRYGVIKQEVDNPVDSLDIKTQVLSSKNF